MKTLNVIDIASHQAGFDPTKVAADGIIVKVIEGTGYVNPYWKQWADATLKSGKVLGLYMFLHNGDTAAQAKFFLSKISNYISKATLHVDYEPYYINNVRYQATLAQAQTALTTIKSQSGVTPMIYVGLSDENKLAWPTSITSKNGLWVAQYNTMNAQNGFIKPKMIGSVMHWKGGAAMHQYSSAGRLNGWKGSSANNWNPNLDFSIFYGDKVAWSKYSKSTKTPSKPSTPPSKPSITYSTAGKSLEQMANDVIAKKVGSDPTRSKLLGKYAIGVQAIVNRKLAGASVNITNIILANETKANRYGSGDTRKKLLGSYWSGVQAIINKGAATYYTVKSGDSVSAIAAKYKTTVANIVKLNSLKNANLIYAGQRLRVK